MNARIVEIALRPATGIDRSLSGGYLFGQFRLHELV
jgi:hypothetical protein